MVETNRPKIMIFHHRVSIMIMTIIGLGMWFSISSFQKSGSSSLTTTAALIVPTPTPISAPSPTSRPQTQPQESIATYAAWFPAWDHPQAKASLQLSLPKLDTVLPVWYELKPDGSFGEIDQNPDPELLRLMQDNQITIIPSIANHFDPKRTHSLLTNPTLQNQMTNQLISQAKMHGYEGWDIDWEEIYPTDAEHFSHFLTQLNTELDKHDLTISIAVHARTGTNSDWQGALGHDYSSLGKAVDVVRIMAYDFHHATSKPGPTTPINWLGTVLMYARKHIPAHKINVGLPTYGYDWGTKGIPVTYQEALKNITDHQGSYQWSQDEQSILGVYQKDHQKHTVWFENHTSVQAKVDYVIENFGITSFTFWRLGGEDPNLWERLQL